MGREFLEQYSLHSITEIFPSYVESHSQRMILISLIGFSLGYVFLSRFRITFRGSNEKASLFNKSTTTINSELSIIRKVSKYYYYAFICLLFISIIEVILYVRTHGYTAYYSSFSSRIPYFLRMLGDTSLISFCIYLASLPSKREAYFPIIIYLFYLVLTLGTGRRYTFVAGILLLFVYSIIRNNLAFEFNDEKWISRRIILISIVSSFVLIIALSYIGQFRNNGKIQYLGFINTIIQFFYDQGVSINVIKRSFQNPDAFVEGRWYMFGTIIRMLKTNAISRLLGVISYGGNTIENAEFGYSFAHALSYNVMGNKYLEGGGTGSSYIAEVYYSLGYLGVFVANIVYGYLCRYLFRFDERNIWINALSLIVFQQIIFAPRGNFDGFLSAPLDLKTWATFLIIYLVSRQLIHSNYSSERTLETYVK